MVPYLLGQPHPLGKRLASVQKCIRTRDIEEVGDQTHHTFFEMLGNWSLGDYWKKEAIELSFEFLTKTLKLEKDNLAVSCFKGDKDASKDTESEKIWLSLSIPKERIVFLGKEDNWWGPAGQTGPCGPDTEIFYWTGSGPAPEKFNPSDKNWVEIWNNVFMEYKKTPQGKYVKAKQRNVDTGMGVERTLAVLNNTDDDYLTNSFLTVIKEIEHLSGKKYKNEMYKKDMRVIADHLRAAVFILGDEKATKPSNIGQGYVLRRLIRRAIRYAHSLKIKENFTHKIADIIITMYTNYPELEKNRNFIITQLNEEENKFSKTLESGIKEFEKLSKVKKILSGKDAFFLYQSYGFPIELTEELAYDNNIEVNKKEYVLEYKKHQDISRTASAGTFKSGLADNSEQTIKLHTATHLLNETLRRVLGHEVKQRGSARKSTRLNSSHVEM